MSPTDKTTWTEERTNMPWHTHIPVSSFSPKAWSAMCQLLGGEERISDHMDFRSWSDGFIVNLGKEEYDANGEMGVKEMRELDGWHNDGDFFVHFLDSPEQALLVIPLWSDSMSFLDPVSSCYVRDCSLQVQLLPERTLFRLETCLRAHETLLTLFFSFI
jgi:hypothetical protein